MHRSPDKSLGWFGLTANGMAGPVGMVRTRDRRDWALRQPSCHDFFAHRRSFLRDGRWRLHCKLGLTRPPRFAVPAEIAQPNGHGAADDDQAPQWRKS